VSTTRKGDYGTRVMGEASWVESEVRDTVFVPAAGRGCPPGSSRAGAILGPTPLSQRG
jgi:hypothetical protein